jgi:acyl-[acyl-carrier-protein] desaturase
MTKEMSEIQLMHELEPKMEELYNRHDRASKFWVPDEYVPWSRGRDYNFPWVKTEDEKLAYNATGVDWEETQATYKLSEEVKSALIIAAMTEDNLPSYHREIALAFGYDGAWRNWVNRWTAEEDRHGRAIHNLLAVSRAVDPIQLEKDRMVQVGNGFTSGIIDKSGATQEKTPMEVAVYVAYQELATVKAHENTGEACLTKENTGEACLTKGDRIARELFKRVAKDEVLHWVVYRDLVKEAFDMAPDMMMRIAAKEVKIFQMPGASTIPRFGRHAINVAVAGIYDLTKQNEEVFVPNLGEKHWNVWNRNDLSAAGEQARDELNVTLTQLRKDASNFDEFLEAERERRARIQQGA